MIVETLSFTWLFDMMWRVAVQTALVAAIVWLIVRYAKDTPASFRYGLWVLVVTKFFIPPMVHLPSQLAPWSTQQSEAVVAKQATRVGAQGLANDGVRVSAPDFEGRWRAGTDGRNQPIASRMPRPRELASLVWATGTIVMLLLLVLRIRKQGQLLAGCSEAEEKVNAFVARAASSLDMRGMARLRVSENVCVPTLIGVFRPVIILPRQVIDSCCLEQINAMLFHELAHIKRHDMIVVWLYELARVLFFFHPAIWLAGRGLAVERELACDELVLASQNITRQDYAAGYISALKIAASVTRTPVSLAMAEPFEMEKRRLQMILRQDTPKTTLRWLAAMAGIAVICLPTFAGISQEEPDTAFGYIDRVAKARKEAESTITSGKGDMLTDVGFAAGPANRFRHTKADAVVAFRGNKFARLVRNDEHGWRRATSYDGASLRDTTYWWKKAKIWDSTTVPTGTIQAQSVKDLFDIAGQTYPNLTRKPFSAKAIEGRIVGRERINGNECVIVERYAFPERGGFPYVDTLRLWIDPARGYVVPRWELWSEGGIYQARTLLLRVQADLRLHGTIWAPVSYSREKYALDTKTKHKYLKSRVLVKYAPDFALNVPVTESDLDLPQLHAKTPMLNTVPKAALPSPDGSSPEPTKSVVGSEAIPKATPMAAQMPCEGRITTPFGYRVHPITKTRSLHTGIDIAAPNGTPIRAAADGSVMKSGWSSAYGNTIIIDHGQGVTTLYAHCSKLAQAEGQAVRRGDIIGYVGATGYAEGPRCHFEIRMNGIPVNPMDHINRNKSAVHTSPAG